MYPLNYLWRFLARNIPNDKLRYKALLFAIKYSRGRFFWRDDFGNLLMLEMGSFVDGYVFVKGSSEPQNIGCLQQLIRNNGCTQFIDVGGNLGLFSLTMAAMPEIEMVHAFEPDPRNFAQFMGNVFLNERYTRIRAYNMALGTEEGQIDFYPSRYTAKGDARVMNAGTSSVTFDPNRHKPEDRIQVRICRADELLQISNKTIAIKIDVEGYELPVLHGMRRLLTENQCVILVEIFEEAPQAPEYLYSLGYRLQPMGLEPNNFCFTNIGK
jgi:FkbM family methyltransferase